jgi:hypothetical protein
MSDAHYVGCAIWTGGECDCKNRDPEVFDGSDIETDLQEAWAEIERLRDAVRKTNISAEDAVFKREAEIERLNAQLQTHIVANLKLSDEVEQLRGRDAQWAMDVLKLTKSLQYMIGIAERGLGRKITDAETDRQFVLTYVQGLETEIERLRVALCDVVDNPWDYDRERVRKALGDDATEAGN